MAKHTNISPINPSLHFLIFLVMALVLVVVMGNVLSQVSQNSRAALMCPQSTQNQKNVIENLSRNCKYGIEYLTDANGCGAWNCKKGPIATPKNTITPRGIKN